MMEREDKSRNKQQNRRRGSLRLSVLIILLCLAVVSGTALMLPVFDVTEVYCEGDLPVEYEEIINTANLKNGKNIFLQNVGGARRRLEAMPKIKSAEVCRVFPNKICIKITARIPIAYIGTDGGYALVADDKTVIERPDGDKSAKIAEQKTPRFDSGTDADDTAGSSDDKEAENGKSTDEGERRSNDGSERQNDNEQANDEPTAEEIYNVPLVAGIELKDASEGNAAKAEDAQKADKLYELCSGLKDADLLNRTTYINFENTDYVTIVVENRLEVLFGKAENIAYRCKFLSEVINKGISAAESVILDYTGDDIYARPRDDGGERVKKPDKQSESGGESSGADEEKSNEETSGSENGDTENDTEASDEEGDDTEM